jgi:DNA-binding response OmpR family regulator
MKVLYMTGYSRNAVVHQGRLDEGVDLLQKPISQAELAHRIRMSLDRPKRGTEAEGVGAPKMKGAD